MYLGEHLGQPPAQIDTSGAIVSAPTDGTSSANVPTVTVIGQRPVNWVPWVVAAGLAIAVLYLLAQQRGR